MRVVVGVCWAVVGVVWIVGAIYNAVRAPRTLRRGPGRLQQAAVAVFAWFLLARVDTRTTHSFILHSVGLAWAGVVVLVASSAMALWARGSLGRMWSSQPTTKEGPQLRTGGPYALARHPIYTGLLGMLLGTAMVYGSGEWALVLVASVLALDYKIRVEERLMGAEFPGEYAAYRRRVPQLVPGLYLLPGMRPR